MPKYEQCSAYGDGCATMLACLGESQLKTNHADLVRFKMTRDLAQAFAQACIEKGCRKPKILNNLVKKFPES